MVFFTVRGRYHSGDSSFKDISSKPLNSQSYNDTYQLRNTYCLC